MKYNPVSQRIHVGIDLGTTHTVVCIANNNNPVIMPLQGESLLMPSIIGYDDSVYLGLDAIGCDVVLSSFKKLLGQCGDGVEGVPHIVSTKPILLGPERITPIEAVSKLLLFIRKKFPYPSVLTVPAYFDDNARQAMKEAAIMAGVNMLRLLNEPTAAALAYGIDNNIGGTYVVYDLGGGTFDVSLLKLQDSVFQVIALGGNTNLGGDNIDTAILKHFGKNSYTYSFLKEARQAKEALSDKETVQIKFAGDDNQYVLTRENLKEISYNIIKETIQIVENTIGAHKIDGIILVGGGSKLYGLYDIIKNHFSTEILNSINPDTVVASGAALHAENIGEQKSVLLIDAISFDLGIETLGGSVDNIIPRNSPLPIKKSEHYTTFIDGQTNIVIHVVQGNYSDASLCKTLAKFELRNIPQMPAKVPVIQVTYQIDVNGILTVTACEKNTGIAQEVVIV